MGVNGPPTDWSTKDVFTTGEAAEVCRVSQQTIIRCFDAGRLTGFKVPGSRFRRIPRDELLRFMRNNNIPTDAIESAPVMRVMLVSADAGLQSTLRDVVAHDPRLKDRASISVVGSALAAGVEAVLTRPGVIVLSHDVPGLDMESGLRLLSGLDPSPTLICAVGAVSDGVSSALRAAGAAIVISASERKESIGAVLGALVRPAVSENGG